MINEDVVADDLVQHFDVSSSIIQSYGHPHVSTPLDVYHDTPECGDDISLSQLGVTLMDTVKNDYSHCITLTSIDIRNDIIITIK